jgi:hypothetical protein
MASCETAIRADDESSMTEEDMIQDILEKYAHPAKSVDDLISGLGEEEISQKINELDKDIKVKIKLFMEISDRQDERLRHMDKRLDSLQETFDWFLMR